MPLSKVQNIFWGKVCHTSWARCFVKTLLRNISGDTGDWGLDMITPLFTSSGEWIPLSFEQRAQIMQIFTLYDARHALSDNRKFDVCLPVRALRKLEDNLARTWVSGPFVICLWYLRTSVLSAFHSTPVGTNRDLYNSKRHSVHAVDAVARFFFQV